jgi:hypothetical protein
MLKKEIGVPETKAWNHRVTYFPKMMMSINRRNASKLTSAKASVERAIKFMNAP